MWDDADIEESSTPAPPEVPAEEAKPEETQPEVAEPPPPETVVKGTEPRRLVFKHWVRPKFLQYNYLYDYQHNYYDDVINYMDRRNLGMAVEKPRAQTWAERVLRTYISKSRQSSSTQRQNKDYLLLKAVSTGARFHRYHTKSLISRKYSHMGFNCVSI